MTESGWCAQPAVRSCSETSKAAAGWRQARSLQPAGGKSLSTVAAPDPDQRVRQRLLENAPVAVAGGLAENKTMGITFGFKRRFRAQTGHHPVVIRFFRIIGTIVVLRNMSENTQGLGFAGLD